MLLKGGDEVGAITAVYDRIVTINEESNMLAACRICLVLSLPVSLAADICNKDK